jgi:hypothetical protein
MSSTIERWGFRRSSCSEPILRRRKQGLPARKSLSGHYDFERVISYVLIGVQIVFVPNGVSLQEVLDARRQMIMIARMKPLLSHVGAFLLALCLSPLASAQDDSSSTRRFSGVYVNGWEVQLFIENGRENEQPHWIAMTPEARTAIGAVLPRELEAGEGVRVRITFEGRLSPPGRYGHLGVYPHTVLVENLISAEMEGRPTAYCDAAANGEWASAAGRRFRVEATTSGPSCRQSAALIIVRNAEGELVWTDARPAAFVAGLNTPTTRTPMTQALHDWIGFASRGQTTADLPPWPNRAEGPSTSSGFEFEPEAWINRETYLDMRERAEAMFCYVQGLESLACLIERDGRLEKIGVQAFPG